MHHVRQTAHHFAHKIGTCNNWVNYSSSSSLQARFSIHWLPTFGTLKDALRRRRSADDDEPKHSVSEEVRNFSKDFETNGLQRFMKRWKNCLDSEVDSWKNNFNFEKV